MILTVDMLCIMGVGSVLALIYCGILVFNNKYDGLLEPLNSKEYPLCETYNVGFYLINKIPRLIQNAHVRSKRQYIEILHGAKYADYYLRINSAQSLSLSLLVFVLSFFVYGLTAEPVVLVVMFVMAVISFWIYVSVLTGKFNHYMMLVFLVEIIDVFMVTLVIKIFRNLIDIYFEWKENKRCEGMD